MKYLIVDIETTSGVDLKNSTVYAYAKDPDFAILLIGFKLIDFTPGPGTLPKMYIIEEGMLDLKQERYEDFTVEDFILEYPETYTMLKQHALGSKVAHNAQFERVCFDSPHVGELEKLFRGKKPEWLCTQTMAQSKHMHRSLEDISKNADGHDDKMLMDYMNSINTKRRGKKLINLFSIRAQEPSNYADEWGEFKDYCMNDVTITAALFAEYFYSEAESLRSPHESTRSTDRHVNWCLNELINDRGIPINLEFLKKFSVYINYMIKAATSSYLKHVVPLFPDTKAPGALSVNLARALAEHPNSPPEMKSLMHNEVGKLTLDSNKRKELIGLLPEDEPIRDVLIAVNDMRKYITLRGKVERMMTVEDTGGRYRGAYSLYGARTTGRYSSYGLQAHNMHRAVSPLNLRQTARDAIECIDDSFFVDEYIKNQVEPKIQARELLRSCIKAPEGRMLIKSDYKQIEARVAPITPISFYADSSRSNEGSMSGRDRLNKFKEPDFDLYTTTASTILKKSLSSVTKQERQIYGKTPELAFGYGGGVKSYLNLCEAYGVTPPSHQEIQEILNAWRSSNIWALESWTMLETAFEEAMDGIPGRVGPYHFSSAQDHVFINMMRFPDYTLTYHKPSRDSRGGIVYQRPFYGGKYVETTLWGGKILENVTQAYAAAILRAALRETHFKLTDNKDLNAGIIMHTHDEIVVECDEDTVEETSMVLKTAMLSPQDKHTPVPLDVDMGYGPIYGEIE